MSSRRRGAKKKKIDGAPAQTCDATSKATYAVVRPYVRTSGGGGSLGRFTT